MNSYGKADGKVGWARWSSVTDMVAMIEIWAGIWSVAVQN